MRAPADLLARRRKRGIMPDTDCANVAQLVEQRFRKPQVVGSIPTVGSSFLIHDVAAKQFRGCQFGRARRGGSGSLYPEEIRGCPATRYSWVEFLAEAAMWVSKPQGGVEGRVRCNGCLRTPPGSEDSNGKLDVPCAVGSPGRSFNCGAQADVACQREVHDHFSVGRIREV